MLSVQVLPAADVAAQLLFPLKPPESFIMEADSPRFEDLLASYSSKDTESAARLEDDRRALRQEDSRRARESAGDADLDADSAAAEASGLAGAQAFALFARELPAQAETPPDAEYPAALDDVEGAAFSAGGAITRGGGEEEAAVEPMEEAAREGAAGDGLGLAAGAPARDLGAAAGKTAETHEEPRVFAEQGEDVSEKALARGAAGYTAENAGAAGQRQSAGRAKKANALEKTEEKPAGSVFRPGEGRALFSDAGTVSRSGDAGKSERRQGKNAAQSKTASIPAESRESTQSLEPNLVWGGERAAPGKSAPSVTLTVQTSAEAYQAALTSAESEGASRAGSTGGAGADTPRVFLPQELPGDLVRHANIMLREGGEGLIRLSLKPESLGEVRIRLDVAGNKVSGQIIVETKEALKAFEEQIHQMEKAFEAQGYDSARLEMSFSGSGAGGEPEKASWTAQSGANVAARYESASAAASETFWFFPERELDVFA